MSWPAPFERAQAVPAWVMAVGAVVSVVVAGWLHGNQRQLTQAAFDRAAQRIETEIRQRFTLPLYGLRGALASIEAARAVGLDASRAPFRAYVQARALEREFPGLRGIGYIQRVERGNLAAMLARERADGAPDFTLRQLDHPDRDDLYIIRFIEPPERNPGAQGLDVGSEDRRRAAIVRAVETGEPTLTEPITLVQDGQKTPGFLIYLPMYRKAPIDATPGPRRSHLAGVLYAPVVARELLAAVVDAAHGQVDFQLYAGTGTEAADRLVFDAQHLNGRAPGSAATLTVVHPLELLGSAFTLRLSSTPTFEATIGHAGPLLVLAGGLLLSAILAWLSHLLVAGRRRAERLAAKMTVDLDRLATVARHTADAVVITDLARRITWVNAAFEHITGYASSQALGQSPGQLLQFEGTDAGTVAAMRAALGRCEVFKGELLNRRRDGVVYWIELEIQPMHDRQGVMTGFLAVESDITARKLAEAALQSSRSFLDRTGRIGGVGGWQMDLATQRLEWSDQTCRIHEVELGHRPTLADALCFFPPESRPLIDAAIQRCRVAGEGFDLELPFVSARGRRIWVRTVGEAEAVDGRPVRLVGAYQDISSRREAQAEVRRSSALLRGAIEAIDEAFVLFDPDDRLVFCNDKYRQIYAASADLMVTGATFEQIVRGGAERGQYAAAVGRVDEWVAERMAAHRAGNRALVQRLDTGRTLRIVERHMPDGHIVGFRIDISELVNATDAAQAASTAKSQFLANMSHEIRTPMNAILGMLALMRKTDMTAQQADYASKTEGAARGLLGLLNDILDFSKIEAGKLELDLQPLRVDQLLGDLSVVLSASVGLKPLDLLFDVDPAVPPLLLLGDATRLQQVLINLAGNAIKFTHDGEVVVAVVVQAASADAVRLGFSVRDTGIGIAAGNQARIFSAFTQAEASITRRFGGSGLGLPISQRLVALMGGQLQVRSQLGVGTQFDFSIELQRLDDAAAAPPAGLGDAAQPRVLIVDDHPGARDVLARAAASLGWGVLAVADGAQALQQLRQAVARAQAFDAVLLDAQLPAGDAWVCARRIRAEGATLGAPTLLMMSTSAQEAVSQRSEADARLVEGCLFKPFTASMLAQGLAAARTANRPLLGATAVADGQRLAGLRLLLVEDNPNNQQVARELLAREGALVRVAGDGRAAVDAVASASPPLDLVLMDLQMPLMDGLSATRFIRHELGERRLPIVAMTANAMAADRDDCLQAGMNDHVGKPFDLDELVQLILRLVGRGATAPPLAERVALTLPAELHAAAALAEVELAPALARLGGKADVYQRSLRAFLVDLAALPGAWQASIDQGQLQRSIEQMHTLKGLAATLGVRRLVALAADAERTLSTAAAFGHALGEGGDRSAIEELGPAVAEALHSAHAALNRLLQALPDGLPSGAAAHPLDEAQLRHDLHRLQALLQDSDMGATDLMLSIRGRCSAAQVECLQPLAAAVAALDFEAALPLCEQALFNVVPIDVASEAPTKTPTDSPTEAHTDAHTDAQPLHP